jgi:hypothetical protein
MEGGLGPTPHGRNSLPPLIGNARAETPAANAPMRGGAEEPTPRLQPGASPRGHVALVTVPDEPSMATQLMHETARSTAALLSTMQATSGGYTTSPPLMRTTMGRTATAAPESRVSRLRDAIAKVRPHMLQSRLGTAHLLTAHVSSNRGSLALSNAWVRVSRIYASTAPKTY